MSKYINDAATDAESAIKVLKDVASNGDTYERRVEAGAVLWEIHEASKKALEVLKSDLRELAKDTLNGAGTFSQDGEDLGWAKVIVSNDALRIRKGGDPLLDKDLEGWEEIFDVEQRVSLRKDAAVRIASIEDSRCRQKYLDLVESYEQTPRVSFKRSS